MVHSISFPQVASKSVIRASCFEYFSDFEPVALNLDLHFNSMEAIHWPSSLEQANYDSFGEFIFELLHHCGSSFGF